MTLRTDQSRCWIVDKNDIAGVVRRMAHMDANVRSCFAEFWWLFAVLQVFFKDKHWTEQGAKISRRDGAVLISEQLMRRFGLTSARRQIVHANSLADAERPKGWSDHIGPFVHCMHQH